MKSSKIRVLLVTYCPPVPTWGGAMAFYRHFVEQDDFEISVLCSESRISFDGIPYKPLVFGPSRLTQRLFRTRLMPWLYGPHSLTAFGRVPRSVLKAADSFRPDIVFTIAGTWDWSALVAQRISRRLGVPLMTSFNDWFNYGWFPSHPVYHRLIERRFRRLYREADLALCTSEGMREALGPHPNAHILYPIGAARTVVTSSKSDSKPALTPFRIAFGGSLGDWYGPMLERMVRESEGRGAPLEFRFYGSNPTWSREFDRHAKDSGIYRGQLPFDELRKEMDKADALILPMGFAPEARIVETTSFKTKFLDYLTYRRPIVVWGPEYCSAIRVAREFSSAAICIDPNPSAVVNEILMLKENPDRQSSLVAGAERMYLDRFEPSKIHSLFVEAVRRTISAHNSRKSRERTIA